ncbi:MAG: SOS response-associated peptidase [Ilumatobacteraceae bacterium]
MCGRFVSSSSAERIAAYFGASFDAEQLPANFNVAPTNDVYGVVAVPSDNQPAGSPGRDAPATRVIQPFHWGLVPSWAKDTRIASKMINARAETIAEKPAFKGLLRKHRMIIPMDGFYEWQQGRSASLTATGKPLKQPFFIHRADGQPLAVAGLWAMWRDKSAGPDGPWLHSCAVVTTAANHKMEQVHDRMPALLPASAWDQWLDPFNDDVVALRALLIPAADDLLEMHPVSRDVNNVRNKGPHLVDEIDPAAASGGPGDAEAARLPLD